MDDDLKPSGPRSHCSLACHEQGSGDRSRRDRSGRPAIAASDGVNAPGSRDEEPPAYKNSPALAGITGACRDRTVLITSVLSIPCR